MTNQRGIALSGLIMWGVVIALVAMVGIKLAPEYLTYFKILKATKAVALNSSGRTVPEIRASFGKYLEVEHVSTITPADLDISKEGSEVIIGFAYESRVPLVANVSLLIDFEGSSSGRE